MNTKIKKEIITNLINNLTIGQAEKLLDVDIYDVAIKDEKIIYDKRYYYYSYDNSDNPYRCVDYSGMELNIFKVKEDENLDYYNEMASDCKQYICDLTEQEFLTEIKLDLAKLTPLLMKDVDAHTPCGSYLDIDESQLLKILNYDSKREYESNIGCEYNEDNEIEL